MFIQHFEPWVGALQISIISITIITLCNQLKLNHLFVFQNAQMGGIPNFEHDESLYLEKREQMFYNVENANRVETKYNMPPREKLLRPDFHSEMSRYQSELMFRRDRDTV